MGDYLISDEEVKRVEHEKWQRRDQWLIDLDLQTKKAAIDAAVGVTKVLGLLSGAAIIFILKDLDYAHLNRPSSVITVMGFFEVLGMSIILGFIIYFSQTTLSEITQDQLTWPVRKDEESLKFFEKAKSNLKIKAQKYQRLALLGEFLAFFAVAIFIATSLFCIWSTFKQ